MTLETKHDTAEWTRLKEVERLAHKMAESLVDLVQSHDLRMGKRAVRLRIEIARDTISKARATLKV